MKKLLSSFLILSAFSSGFVVASPSSPSLDLTRGLNIDSLKSKFDKTALINTFHDECIPIQEKILAAQDRFYEEQVNKLGKEQVNNFDEEQLNKFNQEQVNKFYEEQVCEEQINEMRALCNKYMQLALNKHDALMRSDKNECEKQIDELNSIFTIITTTIAKEHRFKLDSGNAQKVADLIPEKPSENQAIIQLLWLKDSPIFPRLPKVTQFAMLLQIILHPTF